jgi:dienelactone hydrolase
MQHTSIDYFVGSDRFVGELVYTGELNKSRPIVIIFHAMEGRGQFCVDYAKRLAENGFVAFVADIYGEGKSTHDFAKARSWLIPVISSRAIIRERSLAALNTVSNFTWVNKDKIGALGFCLGGMCVLEICRSGATLKAGITIHGVLKKSELETKNIGTKLLIQNGYMDPSCPPAFIEEFAKEMNDAGNHDWVFVNFGNAKHSFSDPLTGTFDPESEKQFGREYNELAANRSFRYSIDFLKEMLDL